MENIIDPTTIRDPMELFQAWLTHAEQEEPNDPNAMCIATVDQDGMPSSRMVLLKGCDARGFIFYTNKTSAKADALSAHPVASLCFHWKSLRKQVRIVGDIEDVSDAESDAYFATRSRKSQLGAWASEQSSTLSDRSLFESSYLEHEKKYDGIDVLRPPHWGGYLIKPRTIEFWQDAPYRLHDRTVFTRTGTDWSHHKLYP